MIPWARCDRCLVSGPRVSSGLPHHTFTTVCPTVCRRSGAIMADDRPPLTLDARGHDWGGVWCLWSLVIVCIKTVKNVMHFIRRPISHIEILHSSSVEQLQSPVAKVLWWSCRLKLHTGDDYHGLLTLRVSTWRYVLPSVLILCAADCRCLTNDNRNGIICKKIISKSIEIFKNDNCNSTTWHQSMSTYS